MKAHWRTEWKLVVYSDESGFSIGVSDGLVLVRRRLLERLQPNYLRPRHTRELPFMYSIQGAAFQQDNTPLHTTIVTQCALQRVDMLSWPSRLRDLSPIEHVWDIIG
ncbi:transposable element Tc1 transposase [Trichonephila clavipes]|nr:transposable element Tc1 transposase [Trichonephila clavipes]